jgi:hypothetical protein
LDFVKIIGSTPSIDKKYEWLDLSNKEKSGNNIIIIEIEVIIQ